MEDLVDRVAKAIKDEVRVDGVDGIGGEVIFEGDAARAAIEIIREEYAAALAAKDAEIERLKKEHKALRVNRKFVLKRAEAAEAEVDRLNKWVSDYGDASRKGHLRKDAEIERLRRDLGLAAQHAAAADAECERRIAAHQAAEAEVARLKGINELQADLLNGAIKRARDERERCARVVEGFGCNTCLTGPERIADAIRAG